MTLREAVEIMDPATVAPDAAVRAEDAAEKRGYAQAEKDVCEWLRALGTASVRWTFAGNVADRIERGEHRPKEGA